MPWSARSMMATLFFCERVRIMFRNNKSVRIGGAWPLLGDDFDPAKFDEGVRILVVDLNRAGYETLASCQGGVGHHWSYYDETHNDGVNCVPQISINGWCTVGFANRAALFDLSVQTVAPSEKIPFEQTYIYPRPSDRDCVWFCGRMRSLFGLGELGPMDGGLSKEEARDLFFRNDAATDPVEWLVDSWQGISLNLAE